jgi:hypothetical protein
MPGSAILETLPEIARGRLGVYFLDRAGRVERRLGWDDRVDGSALLARDGGHLDDGRAVVVRHVGGDGARVITTWDEDCGPSLREFLNALFDNMSEKDRLEIDMESMYSSSLALLEEVAMVGDLMPRLSAGVTDEEVVATGLEALLVAASVDRAVYLRYHPGQGRCELLVQVEMDLHSRRPVQLQGQDKIWIDATTGIVRAAIDGTGTAFVSASDDGSLWDGGPDLVRREAIAVPVRYGYKHDVLTLGVVVVMDKRATSYSNVVHLGSQESKIAAAIASMVGSVLGNRMIAEFSKELKLATEIQQQILPDRPAEVPEFDLAGRCETSGAVGGDYFDFLPMADSRTLAVVADVSGHNLASGMVMVSARSALRLLASKHDQPTAVFQDLADSLFHDLHRTERFITAAAVALAPSGNRLHVVNAGHNDTLIYRAATGSVERLPSDDTVLGFLPGVAYTERLLDLATGDVVLLYTDGVTEAMAASGEMFGEERLESVLSDAAGGTAADILEAVYAAVVRFTDASERTDDITAVVIKRTGGSGA